jgi:protoporphyrinogen oxidase
MKRREFLRIGLQSGQWALLSGMMPSVLQSCLPFQGEEKAITGSLLGPPAARGHLLREGKFPLPTAEKQCEVLIIGGGITGLTAARALQKQGRDWQLLEMADHVGGNSFWGENQVSAFPWGAHYLPIPDGQQPDLVRFLEETGVIEGYDAQKRPIFNEQYLCHAPAERVYHKGIWFDGLIPLPHLSKEDHQQLKRYNDLMHQYQKMLGKDGKKVFALPLALASQDEDWLALDRMSMAEWLAREGFTSPFLRSYVDYYCRDDYGANLDQTSAWAGLHYFASRDGTAANADEKDVLAWPQGNGWLCQRLYEQGAPERCQVAQMVYKLEVLDNEVIAWVYDGKQERSYKMRASKVIAAVPAFIADRLLPERGHLSAEFTYTPWMVANITCKPFLKGKGAPLCWDNIIYDSKSLGYVNAAHQHLNPAPQAWVLTYYYAVCQQKPSEARKWAFERTYEEWKAMILEEMNRVHSGFEASVENLDVWVWGHGMICPTPGFLWGEARQKAKAPFKNRVFFAHTDLSGLSLFEEGFYQGNEVAKQV